MNPTTAGWANFFAAEVGAAATLTGLVVVAVSINLTRILAVPHLPGRAAEGLSTLVNALVLTSLWLMPNQPERVFGGEALAVGIIGCVVPVFFQVRGRKTTMHLSPLQKAVRVVMNTTAGLLFAAAGLLLLSGGSGGLYAVAVGVIMSLVAGIWNAWVLLVEILR